MTQIVLGVFLNPTLLKSIAFFLSYFFGVFLFWRAAKRELVDSQTIFDVIIFSNILALFIGRITDFLLRPEYYQYSVRKLIFFNVFPGLDFIGSFLGIMLAVFIYTKLKKNNFWYIFDFASFGIVFALAIFNILRFFIEKYVNKSIDSVIISAFLATSFLLVFWVLKRFEKKKRHKGFFAYFFLSCFFLINLASVYFGTHSFLYKQFLIYGVGGLFLVTLISWYISAKRRIKMDAREAFAFVVLVVMKIVRVLTNIREADGVAKSIVLSPVYISKIGLNLVKYLGREFVGTFTDLGKAFGLKK